MATPEITSELTRPELLALYRDHSDYDLVNSLERARVFIQTARILLSTPVRRSASGSRGGEEVELEPRIVLEQLQRAEAWYHVRYGAAQDAAQGPRQFVPHDDYRC